MIDGILKCIPSAAMRQYLEENPISLSVLQQATIADYYTRDKEEAELLQSLAGLAESAEERLLLETAVREIGERGCPGDDSNAVYRSLFPHEGPPLFPFLEICNLPVLFHGGNLISSFGKHYYVVNGPCLNRSSDFTDECYYCYELSGRFRGEDDLFHAHDHIHVCQAEGISRNDLSDSEKESLRSLLKLLGKG